MLELNKSAAIDFVIAVMNGIAKLQIQMVLNRWTGCLARLDMLNSSLAALNI